MAANYLHSLADENPGLQKQIGCVKGVLQIFNRHHFVTGRRIVGTRPKRGHSGSLHFNNGTPERESSVDKHRLSTESSKDSFPSWSPSSPFSNVDYNIDNLDHRGVVKDSMYREIMEQDSDSWYFNEPRELCRSKSCQYKDGFSFSVPKDYPRFSYDGRETESKITNQRLLLDSREQSVRTLDSVSLVPMKQSNFIRDLKVNGQVNADKDLSQTRPPSVVAKLMGLETFPLSKSLNSSDDFGSITKAQKSTRTSRVPVEAAPWKQRDGARAMPSSSLSSKIRVPVCNVYSEVDKRIKNLEFSESGKDLRALKQILEAMQAVEAKCSDCQKEPPESKESKESQIVIMKPAKKGFMNNKMGKDLITKSTRRERQSRPSIPRVDSGKPRKQSNKPQLESRTRRQSSKLTPEKSTVLVKVGEHVTPNSVKNVVKDPYEASNDVQSNKIISFQITRDKLKKVEDLIEKLNNLNMSHNQSPTDYIVSFCENTNPNNTYISQILLSSGFLLRDLKSFKFHSSGHPINPELFSVLEHTKFSNLQKGKFHRKLIFDAVNEILVGRLSSASRMVMVMQDSRKLLRELCLEIEQLLVHKKRDDCMSGNGDDDDLNNILVEDLLKMSENWTGFYGESPEIGMEVEQLIFRDLVDEVVMSCVFV